MKKEKRFCIESKCNRFTYVNSKGLCKDCVFEKNHGGKNKFEVYKERKSLRISIDKPKTNIYIKEQRKRSREVKNNQIEADKAVYKEVFESKPPICEECGKNLPTVFEDEGGKVVYVHQYSHIISKGADKKFRHDIRNFNRLCHICHHKWEFGNRVEMNIFKQNIEIMNKLRSEYKDNK